VAAEPADAVIHETEQELRGCLRDLTGLFALPAVWSGKAPVEILRSLCQVLETVLPIELTIASSAVGPNSPPLRAVRVREQWREPSDRVAVAVLERCRTTQEEPTEVQDAELGTLRTLRLDMGYYGRTGFVCVGSRNATFPSAIERVVLGAAVSLVAGALNSSRLILERERAARAKDEFLAMLGHELRNPLSPIVTALHLIKMRSGTQFVREQEIIERQLVHLTRLVDDLLDVSRVTSGKVKLHVEPIALRDAVAKAVETVAPLIQERRHLLNVEIMPAELVIDADLTRLAQVLHNLLINAAKYTGPGGQIELQARVAGNDVRISVHDNGSGIDPALLPHVFDLFTQGPTLPDRSRGGLGIGLALVKSLVRLHGGRVAAASRGAGHGSEFVLWLPLQQRANATAPLPLPAGEPGRAAQVMGDSILVVDDHFDAASSLADLLRAVGYRVELAHDGKSALAALEAFSPRFAILDIGLPGMSGYELARQIRAKRGGDRPRLIALTGYGQDNDRARALAAGFNRHQVKPVDVDQLLAYLREP
jgi:signal transduction histidine kinase/CheY-like chemotaxis protein